MVESSSIRDLVRSDGLGVKRGREIAFMEEIHSVYVMSSIAA